MLNQLLIFALSLGFGASVTTGTSVHDGTVVNKTYDELEGFKGVVVKQINRIFGTDRLPAANGYPVEPGLYLTLGANQMTVFDRVGASVQGGVPVDTTRAAECVSGCTGVFFDALRFTWLELIKEAAAIGDEAPTRVLIGGEATLPAKAFIDLAYAAAESRPGAVPSLYLLLNAGPGGLRARIFYLVPPGGMRLNAATSALGLRIKVQGGSRFEVSSANGRAVKKTSIVGTSNLGAYLVKLDRQFPSKDAVVLEATGDASLGDLVEAMVATEERFPIPVLSMGDQLKL